MEESTLWLSEAERFDRMLEPFGNTLVERLCIGESERVMDIGCGTGAFTRQIAAGLGPDGHILGIDHEERSIEVARGVHDAPARVDYVVADAASYPAQSASVDVLVSRFGLMLFEGPPAAFRHLTSLLRPGGRLGYVTWTQPERNLWHRLPFDALGMQAPAAQLGPFALAEPAANSRLMRDAGLGDISVEMIEAPAWVGSDLDDALGFLERTYRGSGLPRQVISGALDRARHLLGQHLSSGGVELPAVALACFAHT